MAVNKVYYGGECVMTVDMDYVKEDCMYEYLEEILGMFKERAYKEFNIENIYESEARKVWADEENLYKLKNQIEQEIEGDCFEKVDQLYNVMQKRLNDEEFKLFKKLRNEEVTCFNKLEVDFFAGKGCLDYVWIERNGQKEYRFY